jgi:hypothetical protein
MAGSLQIQFGVPASAGFSRFQAETSASRRDYKRRCRSPGVTAHVRAVTITVHYYTYPVNSKNRPLGKFFSVAKVPVGRIVAFRRAKGDGELPATGFHADWNF